MISTISEMLIRESVASNLSQLTFPRYFTWKKILTGQ